MAMIAPKGLVTFQKSNAFERELSPLFPLSKYLGLFCYNSKLSVSFKWSLVSLIFQTLNILLVAFSGKYVYDNSLETEIPHIQYQIVAFCFPHILNIVLSVSHAIIALRKLNVFQELIDMVLEMDSQWETHLSFYSKKCPIFVFFITAVYYFTFPIIIGLGWQAYLPMTILFINELSFVLILMQFVSLLEIIRGHLKNVNDGLNNSLYQLLSQLKTHKTLLGFCPRVNEAYSWQLLVICLKIFTFALTIAYLIVLDMRTLLRNLYRVLIIIWQLCQIFSLARTCSEISDEVDNFYNKLFNIMRDSKDLCSNEKLHLYVTMQRTVNFTACGFFTLGYPLVTSIIAAATTYLVILVQFSLPT